jgi:hypothetical protein
MKAMSGQIAASRIFLENGLAFRLCQASNYAIAEIATWMIR